MRAGGIKRGLTWSHLGSVHDSVFVRGQSGQARINLLGSRFFGVLLIGIVKDGIWGR